VRSEVNWKGEGSLPVAPLTSSDSRSQDSISGWGKTGFGHKKSALAVLILAGEEVVKVYH
jgi:uncharacterized protein YgiM (DUF1202 family)